MEKHKVERREGEGSEGKRKHRRRSGIIRNSKLSAARKKKKKKFLRQYIMELWKSI